MSKIHAIPTRYAGHEFRSRLEARWAVFFDAIGIRWSFEHEAFVIKLGDRGVGYTPDFWLPDLRGWVEVKPGVEAFTEDEVFTMLEKLAAFAETTEHETFILAGLPRDAELLLVPGTVEDQFRRARWGQCQVCFQWFLGPEGLRPRRCGHESEHGSPEQARGALLDASAYRFWNPPDERGR